MFNCIKNCLFYLIKNKLMTNPGQKVFTMFVGLHDILPYAISTVAITTVDNFDLF